MKYFAFLVSILIACCQQPANAGHAHGTSSGFHLLNIGGSGFFQDITIANDGTMVTRNDSGDAYIWDTTFSRWRLLNVASLTPQPNAVWAAVPARANGNTVFMMAPPSLYYSDDKGLTLTAGNIAALDLTTIQVNSTDFQFKTSKPRIDTDPVNPQIALACSSGQGLFKTTDGGKNWTLKDTLPSAMPTAGTISTTISGTGTNTITVASATGITVGTLIWDTTVPLGILPNTFVIGVSGTTLTLSRNIGTAGIGDTVVMWNFASLRSITSVSASGTALTVNAGLQSPGQGVLVYDVTHPGGIPPNTFLVSINFPVNTQLVLSQAVTGTYVNGDTIGFSVTNGNAPNAWEGCPVAYDPSSSTGGSTPVVYAFPAMRGMYKSTDGGETWTKDPNAASGPQTYVIKFIVGPDGTAWVASNRADWTGANSNFWKLSGGTWSRYTQAVVGTGSDPVQDVAVDPANALHIVLNQYMDESLDGGVSFIGYSFGPGWNPPNAANRNATDAPWLEKTLQILLGADSAFNPAKSNELWLADGIALWWANPPGSRTAFNWTSQTVGADNPTPQKVTQSPNSGEKIYLTLWDRGVLTTQPINTFKNVGSDFQGPFQLSNIAAGWDADWASSDQNTICVLVSWTLLPDQSGCTADNGTTWTKWANDPMAPHVVTNATDNSGQPTIHVVGPIPDNIQPGMVVFPRVQFGPVPATAGTNTADNPAILHLGAGLPVGLSTTTCAGGNSCGANTSTNVAPHVGVSNFVFGLNQITCVNHSGSDCAGTAAGDVTLTTHLGALPINTGDLIYFGGAPNIAPSASFPSVSSVDRVANTITLTANLVGQSTPGITYRFSYNLINNAGGGSIALSTPCNIVVLPQAGGFGPPNGANYSAGTPYPWYTTDCGATWNRVIICSAGCTGFNALPDGSAIPVTSDGSHSTGWGLSYFTNTKQVVADRVQPNTFYLVNCRAKVDGGGIYYNANGGAGDWVRIYDNTTRLTTCAQNTKIAAVQGIAGELFVSGSTGANQALYRISGANCNTLNCATVQAVNGTIAPIGNFGLGAIAPGATYPTLWYWGPITTNTNQALWRTTNANSATPTWTKIATTINNTTRGASGCLEGDQNVWYRVYTCMGGTGWSWGDFPYLLNRDLDPVANDNSPAFLNRVG